MRVILVLALMSTTVHAREVMIVEDTVAVQSEQPHQLYIGQYVFRDSEGLIRYNAPPVADVAAGGWGAIAVQGEMLPLEMVQQPAAYRLDLFDPTGRELIAWCEGSLPGSERCYEVKEVPEPSAAQLTCLGVFIALAWLVGRWFGYKRGAQVMDTKWHAEYSNNDNKWAALCADQCEKVEELQRRVDGFVAVSEAMQLPGLFAVTEERCKQRLRFSAQHDAEHINGELAMRAAELLLHGTENRVSMGDKWGILAKHEGDREAQLRIAGALVCAELDRRAACRSDPS
jgi:hypothetical protein